MANSAPAATLGLTLAALAAATAYGSGPVLLVTAIPMLIIANAYKRLNLWNANCGASFEWVGRAISPWLGFFTGWLMLADYIIGGVALIFVLGPSVLSVTNPAASSTSPWPNLIITTSVTLVMLVIAVAGIRITARTQVAMALVEYTILIGIAVAGLAAVLTHHPGTYPATRGWLSLTGTGGQGSIGAGFLVAVFVYAGWDGTLYVNEEVKHRRVNPGRAAILAVALLAVIYTLAQVGLQGLVSPAQLQAHSTSVLVYVAQSLGGTGWARAMAIALALSVIATTGVGIVLTARIIYGMASYRALPASLANVSPRFSTPVAASVLTGVLLVALTWVYTLATSLQNAFGDVIAISGWLAASFYVLTALAMMAYYRRRILTSAWDALIIGVLPLAAMAFLGWVLVKSVLAAPAAQQWSLAAIIGAGLLAMVIARYGLKSRFFQIQRESDTPGR